MEGTIVFLLVIVFSGYGQQISCPEGRTEANISNCTTFFKCVNGSMMERQCPFGLVYNCVDKICEDKTFEKCCTEDQSKNISSSNERFSDENTIPDPINQNVYYNSKPNNIFKRSVTSSLCPYDGVSLPDVSNCSNYYVCSEGQPFWYKCREGLVFNCITKQCDNKAFIPCCQNDPNLPESTNVCELNGLTIPNYFNCTDYYICENNQMTEKTCSNNFWFKWSQAECAETAECASDLLNSLLVATNTTATTVASTTDSSTTSVSSSKTTTDSLEESGSNQSMAAQNSSSSFVNMSLDSNSSSSETSEYSGE